MPANLRRGARRSIVAALACAALTVAACGGEAAEVSQAATVAVGDAVIIDVRTPEEFAAGHLDGALLIDFKNPSFGDEIAKLDPSASYIIYCRSGNRSAQAATRMREIGIENITDLGSLENASAQTGVAIVQG
ncbi:MAG: rhodanese-like domain-containing protein [Ilumatobacteraceae bacterium]